VHSESLALNKLPHKAFGLYFFNVLVVLLIVYVQFQNVLGVPIKESKPQLSHAIFLVDKILLFSLFLVSIYVRFLGGLLVGENLGTNKRLRFVAPLKSELILFTSLIIFGLWCLISAGINQNYLGPTIFGAFSYMVYFLVFFIFSSIPYKKDLIKKAYIFLLNLALMLSLLSIFQEILALIYPTSANWWPNIQSGNAMWRMGLFRAPSLLGHPNGIGLFALFFFTVELARRRESGLKRRGLRLIFLGLAIFFSGSRSAIGGALIALFLLLPRFRKKVMWSIPVIVLIGALFFPYFKPTTPEPFSGTFSYDDYRKFAFQKSLEIFKDHPFCGVGAGMYGGHISVRYDSPVYAKYGFTGQYFDYLHDRVGSIEQQWLQTIAELGIVGLLVFIILLITPIFILRRLFKKEADVFSKALISALMVMPFQMGFYMLGFTVSQMEEWLIPYFAFVGMLAGARRCKICKMQA